MQRREARFVACDGTGLYSQWWLPDRSPQAVLAIVHGVGEHSSRYTNIVCRLLAHACGVCSCDLRGHGRSEGRRGHINSWQDYRGDLKRFLQMVRAEFVGCPVFLFGHSLGALIALDYVTSAPDEQAALAGLIVSAAPFQPTGVARPHLVALARILSRLWPSFRLPLNLNGAALSRDPEVVESYARDPLVVHQATARWGAEALAAVARVKAGAGRIRLPLLMIHGTGDLVSLAAGSHDFFVRVDFPDKQIKLYSGAYHEPHNDLDHATVTSDLQQWIAQHL